MLSGISDGSGAVVDLLVLAAGLTGAGAVAGLLAGLFGVGGGAIIVPVMDQFLGALGYEESVRMHIAVGTSLATIIPTAIRSYLSHRALGAVDDTLIKGWILAVPAGVVGATLVAAMISSNGLRIVFAVMACVISSKLFFRWDRIQLGSELPGNPVKAIWGMGIGFVSTLMGVGGGVISNIFMTLHGRPIHQAVATSSGVGILIAVPGTFGYVLAGLGNPLLPPFSVGFVNVIALFLVLPLSTLCAPIGVRFAHAASKRQLELAFGMFLLAVAGRFGWDVYSQVQ